MTKPRQAIGRSTKRGLAFGKRELPLGVCINATCSCASDLLS